MVLLEKTLKHIQIQSALTPYVFPDPQALCEHLPVIWQLATGGQLLLIVPNIVVDILYSLRREDKQASADITFLEGELKRCNKYLLCQVFVSVMLVKPRMTRPHSDAWDLCNILYVIYHNKKYKFGLHPHFWHCCCLVAKLCLTL